MTDWYDVTGAPSQNASLTSSTIRSEFIAIETAMANLPTFTGNGSEVVVVNSGGTGLETATTLAGLTLTSPVFTTPQINDTTADHQYIFAVSELLADRTVTLPLLTGNDEFVFKDFIQTLANKTLTSPTIETSPTAAGATWTDLGTVTTADIDGGTLDGVVIGGSATAAATVTVLTATSASVLATGTTIGNLTLADGSITDSSGAIDFGNENLSTTGTLAAGTTTIGSLVLAAASITDTSGTISFGNENLTTTGNVTGTSLIGTLTTAAQPNITSLGTIASLVATTADINAGTFDGIVGGTTPQAGSFTSVTVDNLSIDLNTISATTGALNLTPAAGSAIVLDGTINVDAGVVTGATSITSTNFVGDLTGDVSGSAATVTGATQSAITALGTIASLVATTADINAGTFDGVVGGTTPQAGSFSTVTVDNITINGAAITSNTGAISFSNENLTTTGTLASGNLDVTGTVAASGVTSITDTTDASSTTAASLKTAGGLAVVKKSYFGDGSVYDSGSTSAIETRWQNTGGGLVWAVAATGGQMNAYQLDGAGANPKTAIYGTYGGAIGLYHNASQRGYTTAQGWGIAEHAPASAGATGTAGTFTWSGNYIYVCVATDTWQRAPISTW